MPVDPCPRKLKAIDVIDVLSELFILRGIPAHIRSDNGPEFVAEAVQAWITAVGAKTAYIERGSPWENGYFESFNARLRDELLNGEIFYTLREAQIVIESWRRHYNTIRPHASLGYRPPAPEVFLPAFAAWPAALRRPAPPATLVQRWRITGCRQRKQGSASTPAFHRARGWRRRRPRKTTLGKSRCRTISRVRVDDLLLAGAKRVRAIDSELGRHALDHDRGRSGRTARVSRPKHS